MINLENISEYELDLRKQLAIIEETLEAQRALQGDKTRPQDSTLLPVETIKAMKVRKLEIESVLEAARNRRSFGR